MRQSFYTSYHGQVLVACLVINVCIELAAIYCTAAYQVHPPTLMYCCAYIGTRRMIGVGSSVSNIRNVQHYCNAVHIVTTGMVHTYIHIVRTAGFINIYPGTAGVQQYEVGKHELGRT